MPLNGQPPITILDQSLAWGGWCSIIICSVLLSTEFRYPAPFSIPLRLNVCVAFLLGCLRCRNRLRDCHDISNRQRLERHWRTQKALTHIQREMQSKRDRRFHVLWSYFTIYVTMEITLLCSGKMYYGTKIFGLQWTVSTKKCQSGRRLHLLLLNTLSFTLYVSWDKRRKLQLKAYTWTLPCKLRQGEWVPAVSL